MRKPMKKIIILMMLPGILLILGCEEKATDLNAGQEWAHVMGTVKYSEDLSPVIGAFVRTQTHLETALTDSTGNYDLAIALPKGTQESVTLEIFKEGFLTINIPATIEAGANTPMPVSTLERYLDSSVTDTTGSGKAVTIVLMSLEPDTLSVIGAGGPTSCQIVCEVRDAQGRPVDSLHATQINFTLQIHPGGGCHIYPSSVVTDHSGRVSTVFYSGTMAGIVILKVDLADNTYGIVTPNIVIYQTGAPASIALVYLENDSIAVHGSGGNESSTMTFEVRDAGGSPISYSTPATVNFNISGGPGGDEYLFPVSGQTNAQGQVSTTLNSGTLSGAVQVRARLANDTTVFCTPIPIVIHSGFPDQGHFAVAPQFLNIAGYNVYGVIDSIMAMVGDLYGNPVQMGTAVFFNSSSGIIQGSAGTNADGFATVRLYSGAPTPPPTSPFCTVFAQTIGQGGQILTDNTQVLFSGITQISNVFPPNFTILNGGSQAFTFRVSDQNGYPLVHASEITVSATAGAVMGDVNLTFPDTQSQSWTYFNFALYDDDIAETDPAVPAAIFIIVTSPNGNASYMISGTID
jgi:hypothetical protein